MSHLTIYKASAGSGKTYTLTLQYITLLLGVKDADGVYHLNHKECLPQGEGVQRRRHRHGDHHRFKRNYYSTEGLSAWCA